ncbi:uncharacterized protein [Antedon mediterranea]|uniref:uncharacterized protein isoform X1 n=1 Tax=Antedon mediterranea TaxID=105859 RepID=UPI003AF4AF4F
MEYYKKGELLELNVDITTLFNNDMKDDAVVMRVKNGSRVKNLIGFAIRNFKDDKTRQITFTGAGPAVSKTITCAEIMKRKFKNIHQITKLFRKEIEEYWEPLKEGLDRLKVTRNVPGICILLSKDSLDASQPGYQAAGVYDALWLDTDKQKRKQSGRNRKRQFHDKQKLVKKHVEKPTNTKKDKKTKNDIGIAGKTTGTVEIDVDNDSAVCHESKKKDMVNLKRREEYQKRDENLQKEQKLSECKEDGLLKTSDQVKETKQNAPTQDAPTQDASTHNAPTQDAPTQDAPTQDAPTQDAPTQDAPTQDAPT